ncbi:MAG: leucyl/phenylalanyl-tRNA--protein transferase [Epsilonproteobacteria bacterium]|nr:MAG: leucyl/phenylalanyl-tRNA--protein transferase [Campylobacterota bacterium]RLA67660.1 MAG: leucyl/phenylalanyl-tRNA--protein transferase [Campylobacterota bacterium]
MAIVSFPSIEKADEEGLLALGGDLEIPSLLLAYKQGIFPWPLGADYPLAWFSPDPRGILRHKDLLISKSLKKILRQEKFEVKFNHDFPSVILNCAKSNNRKDQNGTWITEDIILSYINLHFAGHAYSVETYFEDKLVGGMYGVQIGAYVSGESMFYTRSNASKVALVSLMEYLHQQKIDWLDTQLINPFLEKMGALEISRVDYIKMLDKSIKRKVSKDFFSQ